MAKTIFVWDEENVPHIAAHGLTPAEVEPVVVNLGNKAVRSHSSARMITFGMTKTSKYIAVAWEQHLANPYTVRVITAYPVPRPKRRQ